MKDKTKAKIEALQYCAAAIKQCQKSKNHYVRQAAIDLEVEFYERIEALKQADREPGLPLGNGDGDGEHTGPNGGGR
jgi:hypothetical protein